MAAGIEASLPEVSVSVADEAVTIDGRRLGRRYNRSETLRWAIAEACNER